MEALQFVYNEKEVDFLPTGQDNVMVNATQMAKIFGKRIDFFLKTDQTKAFIDALEFPPKGGNSDGINRDEIIQTRGAGGTWMHRILALKFAAWLDPKFEVWVFRTIDRIILGHYKALKEATTQKLLAEKQMENKKKELVEKYPEFIEFLELDGRINEAEKRRLKAWRDSVKQLKIDLFPDTED